VKKTKGKFGKTAEISIIQPSRLGRAGGTKEKGAEKSASIAQNHVIPWWGNPKGKKKNLAMEDTGLAGEKPVSSPGERNRTGGVTSTY